MYTYLARSLLGDLHTGCGRISATATCHASAQGSGSRGKRACGNVGERHRLRELDRVQQLHHDIRHVPERQFATTSDCRSHAQRVQHKRLLAERSRLVE